MDSSKYGYCYDILCKKVINGVYDFKNNANISCSTALKDLEKRKMELKTIITRNDFPDQTSLMLQNLNEIDLNPTQFSVYLNTVMSNEVKDILIFKYEQIESLGNSLAMDYYNLYKKELLDSKNNNNDTFDDVTTTIKCTEETLEQKKIFIVHGHDVGMKESLARFLEKIDFEPIILSEQSNNGSTIIEKFEKYSGQSELAIILFSPDDEQVSGDYYARQNVLFELGYFIGKLGRDKVILLNNNIKNATSLPSDLAGVVYIPYTSENNWKYEIAKEMKNIGYFVDLNRI